MAATMIGYFYVLNCNCAQGAALIVLFLFFLSILYLQL